MGKEEGHAQPRHDVKAGFANETGLHAVGAR